MRVRVRGGRASYGRQLVYVLFVLTALMTLLTGSLVTGCGRDGEGTAGSAAATVSSTASAPAVPTTSPVGPAAGSGSAASGQSADVGGASPSLTTPAAGSTDSGTNGVTTTQSPLLAGVVGKVVDMDTGDPIGGATVTVGEQSIVTGEDGSFELAVAANPGERVLATKSGFIAAERFVGNNRGDGFGECTLELLSETSPNAPPPPPAS